MLKITCKRQLVWVLWWPVECLTFFLLGWVFRHLLHANKGAYQASGHMTYRHEGQVAYMCQGGLNCVMAKFT